MSPKSYSRLVAALKIRFFAIKPVRPSFFRLTLTKLSRMVLVKFKRRVCRRVGRGVDSPLNECCKRSKFPLRYSAKCAKDSGRRSTHSIAASMYRALTPSDQTLQTGGKEPASFGEQEAKIIAMRLGDSPKGFRKSTLRLLARKIVEREIAPAISYQTVARTLKKQNEYQTKFGILGHSATHRLRIQASWCRQYFYVC